MANIKDLRHAIAVLKKRGLITGTTKAGFKIDARSVQPGTIINGKRADVLARKFDDVVSGKVTPVKVPDAKLRIYRKQGYETAQGRVLVPHSAGQTVFVEKGVIGTRDAAGIERLTIPIEFHNISRYLRDLRKNSAEINAMKRRNEWFGIRFFGNHRGNFYRTIEGVLDALSQYDTLGNPPASHSKQVEIFQNLEILRISPRSTRQWEETATAKHQRQSKEYNRKRQAAYRKRLKKGPRWKKAAYDAASAARSKAYRKRLKKNNPTKYNRTLKANRKRAKKSAKKRK